MHLNQKKAVMLLFQLALTLGKWGGVGWDCQPEARWPDLTHSGTENALSRPCCAANHT